VRAAGLLLRVRPGVSRFEETKVKQPKKDLGPHVYIYSDRCIMCTRCVRFARECPGTAELMIDGRGNKSQIDVFPASPRQRAVRQRHRPLPRRRPARQGLPVHPARLVPQVHAPRSTASPPRGDNITIEHNQGKIFRIKPRTNLDVNKWWITDESATAGSSSTAKTAFEAMSGGSEVLSYEQFLPRLQGTEFSALLLTGNYPSEWTTDDFANACDGKFTVLIDTLPTSLTDRANVVLPGVTWAEKAGVFENANGKLQAFEAALPVLAGAQSEGQIAMDLLALTDGVAASSTGARADAMVVTVDEGPGQVPASTSVVMPRATQRYNAANVRREMAAEFDGLSVFETDVSYPTVSARQEPDMEVVEL
jgi:hypothetical protein